MWRLWYFTARPPRSEKRTSQKADRANTNVGMGALTTHTEKVRLDQGVSRNPEGTAYDRPEVTTMAPTEDPASQSRPHKFGQ